MEVASKKVFFVGVLPPPLGGVSVFNERKIEQLRNSGMDVVVVDPRGKTFWKLVLTIFNRNGGVVLSSGSFLLAMFFLVTFSVKRVTVYDHNASRVWFGLSGLKKWIVGIFLRRCHRICLVHDHLKSSYLENGFQLDNRFCVESPFVEPPLGAENEIVADYPGVLKRALGDDRRRIVLSSASKVVLGDNGKDVYCLSQILTLYEELAPKYPDFLFVLMVCDDGNDGYADEIRGRARRLEENLKNFCWVSGHKPMWPLFKSSLCFIRATTTDGDAVSVREAIYFECPVVASNCVPRPIECFLFETELYSDLKDVVTKRLDCVFVN
jgi:glycosyltransferase involved in cell wall biosynthesis